MSNNHYTYIGAYFEVPQRNYDVWDFCKKHNLNEEKWCAWNFKDKPLTVLIPNESFEGLKSFEVQDWEETTIEISSIDPKKQIEKLIEFADVVSSDWVAKFGVVGWGEW